MISVIVGRAEDRYPGGGFFEAARSLGRMGAAEDPVTFWRSELEATWQFWAQRREEAAIAMASDGAPVADGRE